MSEDRYSLYRLCECPTCDGRGKVEVGQREWQPAEVRDEYGHLVGPQGVLAPSLAKCPECRGEGRIRQEIASCGTPEAVGVAIVTLGREREWEGCAFGLLDREGEKGEKWLVLPWLPSARNVRDAARTLARSKKTNRAQ